MTPRPVVFVVLVALVLGLVAGCGGSGGDEKAADPPRSRATTTSPAVRAPTTVAPAPGQQPTTAPLPPAADPQRPAIITTPGEDAANPVVILEGNRYYLYAAQTDGPDGKLWNVPIRTGDSLRAWHLTADALPTLPPWATPGATWAPDIRKVAGRFVLYFTARVKRDGPPMQCIGSASADTPMGPFTPRPDPLICQQDHRGSIDPRTFVNDDGTLWLHWKADDNGAGGREKTSIWAARLQPDGLALAEPGRPIFGPDQVWEGQIVEAPQMVHEAGVYWVFYSANWYNQPAYSIGVAACQGPAGPCIKALPRPWLASNAQGEGPGEASLFKDRDGSWWIMYAPHAILFRERTPRPVALARVVFTPQLPYLAQP